MAIEPTQPWPRPSIRIDAEQGVRVLTVDLERAGMLPPPANNEGPLAEARRLLARCCCEEHDYCDETCLCRGVAAVKP